MKAAPVLAAFDRVNSAVQTLVHTGQHYDSNMSDIFFQQLDIRRPDVNFEVGQGSQLAQMAEIISQFENYVSERRPDIVMVYGDVTSTIAAALVCSKLGIRVAHIEAGLRSGDRSMPEEINRILTDQIADIHFTPSKDANENLKREGIPGCGIHFVGNTMIETLIKLIPKAKLPDCKLPKRFLLVTLHRPSNVDNHEAFFEIFNILADISNTVPVVFPVHPRTLRKLQHTRCERQTNQITVLDPLGYLEFLALQQNALAVITDSGGIQEETTYLGIPCFTLRENTERPVTVELGTNTLIGRDYRRLKEEVMRLCEGKGRSGSIPPLWDEKVGERIAAATISKFETEFNKSRK